MKRTILVTGTGAVIGYGILRALRKTERDLKLVGTDIYADAAGRGFADTFEQAPYTSDTKYASWLQDTVKKHKVDLVIPGIEQDVHFLSINRNLLKGIGTKVVLNTPELVKLSQDKWLMHEELHRINNPTRIPSLAAGDYATVSSQLGLPFLLKPRRSYASKGIIRVKGEADFAPHTERLGSDLIAQPLIGNDNEEYTVAVFGDGTGDVCASIALRRKLSNEGATAKAWTAFLPDLDATVKNICAHFRPVGPTNLQFRRDNDKWFLLEINPRISSATSIRSAFGYNEAEMCIDFYLENKIPRQPALRSGSAVRYIEDMVTYDDSNHL